MLALTVIHFEFFKSVMQSVELFCAYTENPTKQQTRHALYY